MTGLLVSVRSAAEAQVALAGGVDVIDIKEPSRGALGPADPTVWDDVRRVISSRAVVSAALGELLSDDLLELAGMARGLSFVKVGLAGCQAERGWISKWRSVFKSLPQGTAVVPVAYADWPRAGAPSPSVVLALAAQCPARLLLVDTFDKKRGGLLDQLSWESLVELADSAFRYQIQLVLAGSLNEGSIARVLKLRPAYVGVRTAACRGGREGTVDLALVKSLAALVGTANEMAAS